ncbi:MAG: T6SS immunity protein Tdi1 domain-containing protein [Bacteroidota bacterium]
MYNIEAYTIPIHKLDLPRLLKSWKWLTGEDKTMIALTKLGDVIFKDNQQRLIFLDTGKGKLEIIDEDYRNFTDGNLPNNTYEEMLLTMLVDKLQSSGKTLADNQVYSFYKLPVFGGRFIVENMYVRDLYEHYEATGDAHAQIKES